MSPGHAHNGLDPKSTKLDYDDEEQPALHVKCPRDLRIALVDGDEGTHLAVQEMLARHAQGWRLHSYRDTALAMRGIPAARPHVVLMDLCLPDHSGIHCARKLKSIVPELPIVIFTTRTDSDGILLSLQAGACGYLIKPATQQDFFPAITHAAQGRLALCERAERVLVNWFGRLAMNSQFEALTPRERELLPYILQGLNDNQISTSLPTPIATYTVHRHRSSVYKKYAAHSRKELLEKFAGLPKPAVR